MNLLAPKIKPEPDDKAISTPRELGLVANDRVALSFDDQRGVWVRYTYNALCRGNLSIMPNSSLAIDENLPLVAGP